MGRDKREKRGCQKNEGKDLKSDVLERENKRNNQTRNREKERLIEREIFVERGGVRKKREGIKQEKQRERGRERERQTELKRDRYTKKAKEVDINKRGGHLWWCNG